MFTMIHGGGVFIVTSWGWTGAAVVAVVAIFFTVWTAAAGLTEPLQRIPITSRTARIHTARGIIQGTPFTG
jgi:hypothetical protein